jgi:hypothetical protein
MHSRQLVQVLEDIVFQNASPILHAREPLTVMNMHILDGPPSAFRPYHQDSINPWFLNSNPRVDVRRILYVFESDKVDFGTDTGMFDVDHIPYIPYHNLEHGSATGIFDTE